MKDQLRLLTELQTLDQQKLAVLGQKTKVNSEEVRQLWQEIRQMTQTLAGAREKLSDLELACAAQESELAALGRQCQGLEKKLYGGEVNNVKEIEQIRAKSEQLKKEISQRENKLVADLLECENLTQHIALDEAHLVERKRLHAEKQQLVSRAAGRLDAELACIESHYTSLAARVDPPVLRMFRDLSRKMSVPVAKVEGGICGGCRRSIPTGQAAQAQAKLMHCDNCGRILLVE